MKTKADQAAKRNVQGMAFGLVCAVVFAILQNTFNQNRIKWHSWLLAIATWIVVSFSFGLALGKFG